MWTVALWALRRPFPVLLSSMMMWVGELIAVQYEHTWSYRGMPKGKVAPWLAALWVLAAQFIVDVADVTAKYHGIQNI